MTCTRFTTPEGGGGFVCGPTRRCRCGKPAKLECDWKVPTKKSGTCDAPICASCTTSPAPGKDLCTAHAAQLLHPAEAAQMLALSERTLRDLSQRGDLPYVLIGRAKRYTIADLTAFIEGRRQCASTKEPAPRSGITASPSGVIDFEAARARMSKPSPRPKPQPRSPTRRQPRRSKTGGA